MPKKLTPIIQKTLDENILYIVVVNINNSLVRLVRICYATELEIKKIMLITFGDWLTEWR